MLNNTMSNCTCAAAGHLIQVYTANRGKEVILSDTTIKKIYRTIGKYTAEELAASSGIACLDVLNYWRKVGFAGHKLEAFVELNPQNTYNVQHAINAFGGIYVGFALPKTAKEQTKSDPILPWLRVWNALPKDARPSSWAYHCVPIVGYNQTGLIGISWGKKIKLDWSFFVRYADEAYVPISNDWIKKIGDAPSGFNLAALRRDLKNLKRKT